MNFYQQSFHMSPLVEDSNFSYHQTDFNMEPSSLLQCRKADQDWMCEDPHVGSLQWDMAIGNYTFPQDFSNIDSRTYGDACNSSEQLHGLDTSTQEDDVLSYSLSPSDGESDVWSPSAQTADSLSPGPSGAMFTRHLYLKHREEKLFISTSPRAAPSSTRRNRSPSLHPKDLEQPIIKEENSPSEAPILSPSSVCSSRKSSVEPTTSTPVEDSELNAMKKKKAAHNAIEKRYRTNMNAKFVALGSAIPSFRTRPLANSASVKGVRKSVRDGSQPQNKSEILTNALSYIQELQEENRLLQNELNVLKDNLLPGTVWRQCHGAERKW
jgi:hypothetical protein